MKQLFVLTLFACICSSCNSVNEGERAIRCNQQAVQMSTCAIRENIQAIEHSNRAIAENKRNLEEINQMLKSQH